MSPPSVGQRRLVIVGAAGMVGGYALRYALDHPAVGRVTAISRRTLGISHPKLKEVLHRDFADCSALSDPLSGQDASVCGNGADPTGRSRMPFARYKGEAENALLAAGFPRVHIFRPAYIYPVEPRQEPNFSYRLLRAIYPVFRVLFPDQVIPTDHLARTMVDVVLQETGKRTRVVLENRDIRTRAERPFVVEHWRSR